MGLESATYISQLVDTNPAGSDVISQGDDHLRLIKKVVQDSLPDVDQVATTIITKATAPTTQIKGTIWYDTSANTLKINTASTSSTPVWVEINAGAPWATGVFGGSAYGYRSFSVTKGGANQTGVGTGAYTKVTWPTIDWQTSTGTPFASDKFTCDLSGKYHFYTAVKFTTSQLYDNAIALYKNGGVAKYANYFIAYDAGANTGQPTMQLEATIDLSASGTPDYVEVYVHQESGGDLIIDGTATATWFTGYRIE